MSSHITPTLETIPREARYEIIRNLFTPRIVGSVWPNYPTFPPPLCGLSFVTESKDCKTGGGLVYKDHWLTEHRFEGVGLIHVNNMLRMEAFTVFYDHVVSYISISNYNQHDWFAPPDTHFLLPPESHRPYIIDLQIVVNGRAAIEGAEKISAYAPFERHHKPYKATFEQCFSDFPPIHRLGDLGFREQLRSISLVITDHNLKWEAQCKRALERNHAAQAIFARALLAYLDGMKISARKFYFKWNQCPDEYSSQLHQLVEELDAQK
ncbi:hypothetical protein K402DRAFT_461137 [Aulographum hederae CBS 113979]|uniref:Uncharacterized protein n=1 Tax=Aulographum hederae CBS 113979 TaxID=1176131 RepID=A0A6G1H9X8_9PEZI|nr:hypothetical protein K402DRAFT_461137 [Aulographum hederae CBS 113979]